MKPLIYYDFSKTPDGKIAISKERLNEVLEEVYNAGVEDGRQENKNNCLWEAINKNLDQNNELFDSNKNARPVTYHDR